MGLCQPLDCAGLLPSCLTFDPSGELLAIGGSGAVGLYAARSGARTATLRVGDGDSTEIVSLAFSPDSQQLLIAAHQYRQDVVVSALYVASLDGGGVARIEAPPAGRSAAVAFTPEGARVVWVTGDDVVVFDATARGAARIALPRHASSSPAQPETTALVFGSGAVGMLVAADHVFDLDVDAQTADVIAALEPDLDDEEPYGLGLGSVAAPLEEGALLVAERSVDGLRGGRLFRVDDRGIEPLLACEGCIFWIAPSGDRLRFLDLRGSAHELVVSTGESTRLPSPWLASFESHHGLRVAAVSPDGERLAVTAIDAPFDRLVLVDQRSISRELH
ncbi:MAG: hypothetical protein IPG04_38670 [Polyangiaceae bacterium]|nr:hypothetical protein [Polyangiaceae bacterium]